MEGVEDIFRIEKTDDVLFVKFLSKSAPQKVELYRLSSKEGRPKSLGEYVFSGTENDLPDAKVTWGNQEKTPTLTNKAGKKLEFKKL